MAIEIQPKQDCILSFIKWSSSFNYARIELQSLIEEKKEDDLYKIIASIEALLKLEKNKHKLRNIVIKNGSEYVYAVQEMMKVEPEATISLINFVELLNSLTDEEAFFMCEIMDNTEKIRKHGGTGFIGYVISKYEPLTNRLLQTQRKCNKKSS